MWRAHSSRLRLDALAVGPREVGPKQWINGLNVVIWLARAAPRAVRICLVGVVAVRLMVSESATALATACADGPHRFEAFWLFAPGLERAKRILVYLPPGYDCAPARRYPVFYFNDGHDLFEWRPPAPDLEPAVAADIAAREAWYGSWRLDVQLDRAIATGRLPPLIVVGIAADDGMRSRDLAPVPWSGSSEGRGVRYGGFIAHTVVPAIDRRFRTIAHRRCRGIGGASLGAISAWQIALAHPERFGLVLALSPVLRDPALADYLAATWSGAALPGPTTWLVDFDDDTVGSADRAWFAILAETLAARGWQAIPVQSAGGRHAIASWAKRIVPALTRLPLAACSD